MFCKERTGSSPVRGTITFKRLNKNEKDYFINEFYCINYNGSCF